VANSEAGIPDGNFWSNLKMFLLTKPGNFPAEIYSERIVPALDCENMDMQSNCLTGGFLAALKTPSSVPTIWLVLLETPKSVQFRGSGEKLRLHGAALDKFPCMDSLGGGGMWSCSGKSPTFLDRDGPAAPPPCCWVDDRDSRDLALFSEA